MKAIGVILIILGCLELIASFISLSNNAVEAFGTQISFAIAFIGGGIYLINRADKKKQEKIDKNKWANGDK